MKMFQCVINKRKNSDHLGITYKVLWSLKKKVYYSINRGGNFLRNETWREVNQWRRNDS